MPIDLKAFARAGAEARLQELRNEIAEIEKAFPGIGGRRPGRPRATANTDDGQTVGPKRRQRKPMTAAQKKAVGLRMKRYWDERRKAKAAKGAKKTQG